MKFWKYPVFLLMGIAFGAVLTLSQVISFVRVRRMFAFQELHMYLVIGSAVLVGVVGVFLLKLWRKKDVGGQAFEEKPRPFQPGIIGGSLIFGVGWYITAACPGPIYALIGTGEWTALLLLAGALVGVFIFSLFKRA